MALSIKTEEADRLARELARRTGETMTRAVTVALRERLDRTPEPHKKSLDKRDPRWREKLDKLLAEIRVGLDTTPMTKADWDEITDDGIEKYLGSEHR